jgi:hypothetical protein
MVGLLQAPFGTPLYDRIEREGRLTGNRTGDNVDSSTNIVPEMGLEPLCQGYQRKRPMKDQPEWSHSL